MDESKIKYFLGRKNLRGLGVEWEYEPWQIEELSKCEEDPLYFFENYIHIISLDDGKVLFQPYEFQKKIVHTMVDNRFVICKIPRQMGKTTTVAALLIWYLLFQEDFAIAVLAHKESQSREILSRVQMAYEMLPLWMQQGIKTWNKGDIELENGSKIEAEATSSGSIRGRTYNIVYLDEFAHVEPHEQEDFFTSTYPVVTSGTKTKVLITSTPKGMEYFYYIWDQSVKGKNSYVRCEANWWDKPGRGTEKESKWRDETIANTSERQFQQEFECDFLGSADTLIDGKKIATISTMDPINVDPNTGRGPRPHDLWMYERPIKGHQYVCMVDTSRGVGIDYSAFTIIDVTKVPYQIVARFRDNNIPSLLYPNKIFDACKLFNDAYVLIESNDVGAQVADILLHELEYEYLFMSQTKGRAGQQLGGGLGSAQRQLGVKMSKQVKQIGCNAIKTIIESDKLMINDLMIKTELSTFIVKKASYAADDGKHDDLVMTLVMFGWLVNQEFFKELINHDFRATLETDGSEFIDQDMTPFGVIDGGEFEYEGLSDSFYDDPDFGRW